ncbi:RNA-directed DNA polymerase from mobile element jockey-like protein [Pitangus sulphuratus]|nr:RNA-directed DNA polymerase from mobile element jockey-like protein [Pitangus sulphuratus]
MEHFILDVISKHVEEKKVVSSSQYGFTKRRSYLTDPIAFCGGISGWVDKTRRVNVVPLDFTTSFDTVPHNILKDKLGKCGLDEWRVRWIKNWLTNRAQRALISGTGSSWRPVAGGHLGTLPIKHTHFCLNVRMNFSTLKVTEHWNGLPRDDVETPSLEIFQTCLDVIRGNLF